MSLTQLWIWYVCCGEVGLQFIPSNITAQYNNVDVCGFLIGFKTSFMTRWSLCKAANIQLKLFYRIHWFPYYDQLVHNLRLKNCFYCNLLAKIDLLHPLPPTCFDLLYHPFHSSSRETYLTCISDWFIQQHHPLLCPESSITFNLNLGLLKARESKLKETCFLQNFLAKCIILSILFKCCTKHTHQLLT